VAAAAGRVQGRIGEARDRLEALDQRLAGLQAGLARAGDLIRILFNLNALLATLAFLYVLWGQAVQIRRLWAERHPDTAVRTGGEPAPLV
jgi:hypothetical protein